MLIFLSPSSKNFKKFPLKKFLYFLISREMEPSSSNTKKFIMFSYISGNGNPENIPYIAGNRNPKKLPIFQEVTSERKKITSKKGSYIFLYFGKRNFLVLILRHFLSFLKRKFFIFQETKNPEKKFYI